MTNSTLLLRAEQEQIKALFRCKRTYFDVARSLNGHFSAVVRFDNRPKRYKSGTKPSPNQKLSTRMRRKIVLAAQRKKLSARKICDTLGIDPTVCRAQQVLHEAPFLQCSRSVRAHNIFNSHKKLFKLCQTKFGVWAFGLNSSGIQS